MNKITKELKILEEKGQKRFIPKISSKNNSNIVIDGKEYKNFASNDYLNISTNISLQKEFLSQTTSLLSSASARLLTGTSIEFNELEMTLARLFNKEASLIFNTGYQCNLGIISTLCGKGDIVFSDKLNHASIIDGMRLSEGDFIRYKHLDYNHLEELLSSKRDKYNRAIIVSESIFSMDGDIADVARLIELKNKYDCVLMIDEAHAFCAYGDGLVGLSGALDVDIITATFGKALGSFGAFCVSNNEIISYLVNKARSFIFSTSIPPINIAWTNWLLTEKIDILHQQKNKLNILINNTANIINRKPLTHILPVIIGSNQKTLDIAEKLKAEGYYIPAIRPPTVREGASRLRISLTADTNIRDLEAVFKIIREF